MEKVTCFRDFFRFIVVLKLNMNVFQNSVVDLRHVTAERKRDLSGISNGKYLMGGGRDSNPRHLARWSDVFYTTLNYIILIFLRKCVTFFSVLRLNR